MLFLKGFLFFLVKDLGVNYNWLRPWAENFPAKIPSQFFVMDCWLELDRLLSCKLLLPMKGPATRDIKLERAKEETDRIKRLLSALRYLFRNGFWNSLAKLWGDSAYSL